MGAFDSQLGFSNESTYGTYVAPTRWFEYNDDQMPFKMEFGRTEGDPLRGPSRARRQARAVPYFHHAEGTLKLDVMNKGFGFLLQHLLPSVATTGAGPYTHTATEGSNSSALNGKSFSAQVNVPFSPTGTNQPMSFTGGKIPKWKIGNDVDGMLTGEFDMWFSGYSTAQTLGTPSYPASMTNFSWAGGVVTIGGSAFDITNFALEVDQGYDLDRRQIRGNTTAKEPTPGVLGIKWGIDADFDTLTQFNRVASTTVGGLSASIVGTWTNGTDVIAVTVPGARFDEFDFGGKVGNLNQGLKGIGEYDGTNSPITIAYTTADSTP